MVANGLTVYERIPDPNAAAISLGTAIAKSKMFGCESVEQGIVFGWECLTRGMPPLSLAERYHVIFGKLSMKAEAMLAGFEREGGRYKVLSRTPDLVEIDMLIRGNEYKVSLSWADAQNEPFCYEGKEGEIVDKLNGKPADRAKLKLKSKYATPRSRMQMLWARLVSDSVRFLAPNVVAGAYTPEEIEDFDENQIVNGKVVKQPKQTPAIVDSEIVSHVAVVETTNPAQSVAAATAVSNADDTAYCTSATAKRILELYLLLGITHEQQEKALAKRNASSLRNLTIEQAGEILAKLESLAADKQAKAAAEANEIAGESRADEQAAGMVTTPASPCTTTQIDRIKSLLAEYAQTDPQFNNKLKARLVEAGKQKIADLSTRDADKLIDLVTRKQAEQFFKMDLELCAAVKEDEAKASGDVPFDVPAGQLGPGRQPGDES